MTTPSPRTSPRPQWINVRKTITPTTRRRASGLAGEGMTQFNSKLAEVVRRDPRYAYEAYEFVFQSLYHTQKMLGRDPEEKAQIEPENEPKHHVTGPELV